MRNSLIFKLVFRIQILTMMTILTFIFSLYDIQTYSVITTVRSSTNTGLLILNYKNVKVIKLKDGAIRITFAQYLPTAHKSLEAITKKSSPG